MHSVEGEIEAEKPGERAAREEEKSAEDGKTDGSATVSTPEECSGEKGSQAASVTVADPPQEEPVSTHEL